MINEDVDCREGIKPYLIILGFILRSDTVLDTQLVNTYILETDYTYYEILLFKNKNSEREDISFNAFSKPKFKSMGTVYHYPEVVKFLNKHFHSTFRRIKINKLLNNG
jgi:hypothetical protein